MLKNTVEYLYTSNRMNTNPTTFSAAYRKRSPLYRIADRGPRDRQQGVEEPGYGGGNRHAYIADVERVAFCEVYTNGTGPSPGEYTTAKKHCRLSAGE